MAPKGPLCNCGCGERLPEGSMRKYKRGHRARVNKALSDEIDRRIANEQFDGYNMPPDPIGPPSYAFQHESVNVGLDGSFTLEDAYNNSEDDPDRDIWADIDPTKELPEKALKDIEGKIAFIFGSMAGMLNVVDPVCGGAMVAQTPAIARSLTPIICQSPGIVKWFSKTSNVMLYFNLSMAAWPILLTIWNHHLVNHEESDQPNAFVSNGQMNIDPNQMYRIR
jgi:hypothetical protein